MLESSPLETHLKVSLSSLTLEAETFGSLLLFASHTPVLLTLLIIEANHQILRELVLVFKLPSEQEELRDKLTKTLLL